MQPALLVAGLWLVFLGTHIGLATAPIRGPLARRLGEHGFLWLYTAVASVTFAGLVAGFVEVQTDGPLGLDLGAVAGVREALVATIVLGFVLMAGAFAPTGYWQAPMSVLVPTVRSATGLARITRHPFWTGLVLLGAAHMLLARHLTTTVFFAGFVTLPVLGSMHAATKLRARYGESFDRYLETTSAVPFLAILRGKQRLVLRELPWPWLAAGIPLAVAIRWLHGSILAWHGAPLIAAAAGGSVLIGLIQIRRERARARRASSLPAA